MRDDAAPGGLPLYPTAGVNARPFAAVRVLDDLREAGLATVTLGLSPESLLLAWADWGIHMAGAPGKRTELALQLGQALGTLAMGVQTNGHTRLEPVAGDARFAAPQWQQAPFSHWAQAFAVSEAWWRQATLDVPGTQPHHEQVVSFVARQWLDMLSPSNQPWSNPEVLEQTCRQGGMNLFRGGLQLLQDLQRKSQGLPPVGSEAFQVGRDVACTPGKVVMRNKLMELIQYSPATATVHAEPVLLVSAWIMKYYVLDLSPQNSLVRWLVAHGHTVFCISWRNVTAADRDLGMDDYRRQGFLAALDGVNRIVPERKVHALGYCLGGTLLAIAAAAMACAGDERLASVTLLAAQTDFSEPGELQLFIDHSQVHMMDSMMWQRGYLTPEQMSGAFQLLQSNDLIWSRLVHEYMLGERVPMSDLMAWNVDTTRLPQRMHSQYLHRLFLDNALASGGYLVAGHPVVLQNLRVPIFALGTERDHVAPWRSVYKIHYLVDTEVTFVLTSGGHNVGIVNPPDHQKWHYRIGVKGPQEHCHSADEWQDGAHLRQGSWWPAWQHWLVQHSTAGRVAPPAMGAAGLPPLDDAPGHYVMQR